MWMIIEILAIGLMLVITVFYHVTLATDWAQPVSADARRLRAALRKEAPLRGGVDIFPLGRGLSEDMRREIGAVEGFRYVTARRGSRFEYIGRSTGELPDA